MFKILADGTDITAKLKRLFISLVINDNSGTKPDSLTLTLADDGKLQYPDKDVKLEVWTGYAADKLHLKGRFVIEKTELTFPEQKIIIHASAAKLRGSFKTQRDHTWTNTNVKAMVTAMAERNGFKAAVADEFAQYEISYHDQKGQSDADLVNELADEFGATVKARNDRLVFLVRGANTSASGKPLPMVELNVNQINSGKVTLDSRHAVDAVKAGYYDVDAAKQLFAIAGNTSGKRIKKLPTNYDDQARAQAAANAAFDHLQRKEYQFVINKMPTIPSLTAEQVLNITGGYRDQINRPWLITTLTETQDKNGFVQKVLAVTPKINYSTIPRLSNR